MTVTPSMNPTTTVTGVLLAFVGAATLVLTLQTIELGASAGWRSTNSAPAPMAQPTQTRGTNAMGATALLDDGTLSASRGRN
jgi:hypothetical protein